jgi:hypothetical protein
VKIIRLGINYFLKAKIICKDECYIHLRTKINEMNYPAASYGVSNASIRNRPFAASCGELTRMRLKNIIDELPRSKLRGIKCIYKE